MTLPIIVGETAIHAQTFFLKSASVLSNSRRPSHKDKIADCASGTRVQILARQWEAIEHHCKIISKAWLCLELDV